MYVVGGAVRDSLLGLAPKDIDYVAVGTTPDTLIDLGFQQVGQDFPVFLHPKSHVEVALARTERKTQQGHTGFVVHADPSVTLETDLLRRDFTINAMAISRTGELIDPFGGQQDLNSRLLRHVSTAFSEDPLRILRGIRFLAQLGRFDFQLADETVHLMQSMADSLNELSVERVIVELDKTLASERPEHGLSQLDRLKVTDMLAPELPTLPKSFVCMSTDARLAEWVLSNEPTIDCVSRYAATFRFTNQRSQFLSAVIRLKDLTLVDPEACLQAMSQLGWLRGNAPNPVLDALLLEFDQTQLITVPLTRWLFIRDRVRAVSATPFVNAGLSGKALGEAIYAERLRVLSTEISAPGTAPGL
jgi:tRNA nucleotidyltransferase (CCA-adding enzyme)